MWLPILGRYSLEKSHPEQPTSIIITVFQEQVKFASRIQAYCMKFLA
jgi:hypothetical protein